MNKNVTAWILILITGVGLLVFGTAVLVFRDRSPQLQTYSNSVDQLKKEIQALPADTSQE